MKTDHTQRGSVSLMVAFLLPVLIGLAALAIDLVYLQVVRNEMQNDADAAALTGAAYFFDGTNATPNWTLATQKAQAKRTRATRPDRPRVDVANRRPKHLFSGLITCAGCGGGVTMVSGHYYGCAASKNNHIRQHGWIRRLIPSMVFTHSVRKRAPLLELSLQGFYKTFR